MGSLGGKRKEGVKARLCSRCTRCRFFHPIRRYIGHEIVVPSCRMLRFDFHFNRMDWEFGRIRWTHARKILLSNCSRFDRNYRLWTPPFYVIRASICKIAKDQRKHVRLDRIDRIFVNDGHAIFPLDVANYFPLFVRSIAKPSLFAQSESTSSFMPL